ncbi:PhzF family phenazine biosynthesis protein [soil metagenome]
MKADLYQVVTFATDPFRGNPAYVVVDGSLLPDTTLAAVCGLLRTEIIAVIDDAGRKEPALRIFTSAGPHAGAGHASLAAAHVVLDRGARPDVAFKLSNGEERRAWREDGRIALRFPAMPMTSALRNDEIADALGARPAETWISDFALIACYDTEETVAALAPDMERVSSLDRTAVVAMARSSGADDIVVRVFAPAGGLPEDPVCGTAHRIIAPYWSARLGKPIVHSRHLSPRGGDLWCNVEGRDVVIAGQSRLVITGQIELPD